MRAATCPTRQGWRILPDARLESASAGLTAAGRPAGTAPARNWGVAVMSALDGSISVALWGASHFVPDGERLHCRRLGTSRLRLAVDRRGRITARAGGVGPVIVRSDATHHSQYEVVPFVTPGRNLARPRA